MKNLPHLIVLVLTMSMFLNGFAQTDIHGGHVYGIWTSSGSPYRIFESITVPDDSTLNIDAGVVVEFQGYYRINVQGRLLAIGNPDDSITFIVKDTTGLSDPNSASGGWNGIRFIDTPIENDSSLFSYCNFMFGKAYSNVWHENAGGAFCIIDYDKVRISHSLFMNNRASGEEVPAGGAIHLAWSDIKMDHNKMIHNTAVAGGAIQMHESRPVLNHNLIANNRAREGGGISIGSWSIPTFDGDSVVNNEATVMGGGMMCLNDTVVLIENAAITGNKAPWGGGIGMIGVDATINQCVIENNQANDLGGGIAADFSSLDINNTSIFSNQARMSGGIHAWYCQVSLTDTEIRTCTADFGGAIHADYSQLAIDNSMIAENQAQNGGGLHIWNCDLSLSHSQFLSNTVSSEGGAIEYNLADTLVFGRPYQVEMTACLFAENSADFRSGAVRLEQYNSDSSMANIAIDRCTFSDNEAGRIAGIRISGNLDDFEILDSKINFNTADLFNGGTSFSGGSTGKVINSEFIGNTASSGNPGGSGVSSGSAVHYINCTFAENVGGNVGAVFVHRDGKASLTNCILYDNLPSQVSVKGIREDSFSELYINFSDIQFGMDSIETDSLAALYWEEGNISTDPLWSEPEGGDYQLSEGSPCIDVGTRTIDIGEVTLVAPAHDINGLPRHQFGSENPDMGAYEYQIITSLKGSENVKRELLRAYPNPFDRQITLEFNLTEEMPVELRIYDGHGVEVAGILNRSLPAGTFDYNWDPRDLCHGIYICRFVTPKQIIVKKIVLRR